MMENKDKAVMTLTKGVEFLFKKNNVTYFKGIGKLKSPTEITIVDKENKETCNVMHVMHHIYECIQMH